MQKEQQELHKSSKHHGQQQQQEDWKPRVLGNREAHEDAIVIQSQDAAPVERGFAKEPNIRWGGPLIDVSGSHDEPRQEHQSSTGGDLSAPASLLAVSAVAAGASALASKAGKSPHAFRPMQAAQTRLPPSDAQLPRVRQREDVDTPDSKVVTPLLRNPGQGAMEAGRSVRQPHAAAAGAGTARRLGATASVRTAVAIRIAAAGAGRGSCLLPHACGATHEQQAAASAAAAPQATPFEGVLSETPFAEARLRTSDSEHAGSGDAAASGGDAVASGGDATEGPSSPSVPALQEGGMGFSKGFPALEESLKSEAEGLYWDCVTETLEAFGAALQGVVDHLAATGALEERQLLLRTLLRTLQSAESRTAQAAAAADEEKGPHEDSSPVSLAFLLLQLLACPAGRLVWPLLLRCAQAAA
ncbi:family domain-containing protein [Cyclospora cayetanensis]|uniref:Family domain-containing protein n=1 Tax=Cyclospora cayetanensis TaxID=88456 RepID=A0A1D3D0Y9_9EIME|nr:family domain-containing protein [Cyclospora cayetanensis]